MTLWTMDLNGNNNRQFTDQAFTNRIRNVNMVVVSVALSSNGQVLALLPGKMGLFSENGRQIDTLPVTMFEPQWVPNNNCVIYCELRKGNPIGNFDIYSYDLKDRVPRLLAGSLEDEENISISPDGKRIAFFKNKKPHLMNIDGSNQIQLLNQTKHPAAKFAWSPDGKQLAFACRGDFQENVFVFDISSGKMTNFAYPSTKFFFNDISWSPNGRFISFVAKSYSPEVAMIILHDVKTGKDYCVLNDSNKHNIYTGIFWTPDSRSIVFRKLTQTANELIKLDVHSLKSQVLLQRNQRVGIVGITPEGRLLYYLFSN